MKYRFTAVIMAAFLMIPVFGVTALAYDDSSDTDEDVSISAVEESSAFTPDGTGTVLDTATNADSKQFYTITTPAGNIFYLIIDLERDSDNVYFLDAVTEKDLLALAVTSDDTGTGESVSAIPDTTGTTSDTTAAPEPEQEDIPEPEDDSTEDSGGAGTIILAVAVVLIAGGAGYYFKVYRPKQLAGGEDEYEPEAAGEDNSGGWDDTPDDWGDSVSPEDEDDGPPWYDDDDTGEDADDGPPWYEDDTGEDNDE